MNQTVLDDSEFTCMCRKGYYGLRCEHGNYLCFSSREKIPFNKMDLIFLEIDACEAEPCLNDGTCHKRAAGLFQCKLFKFS